MAANLGLIDTAAETLNREAVQEYLNFLDDSADDKVYVAKVEELIDNGDNRLIVNMNDLQKKLPHRASRLLSNFAEEIVCFEDAAKEMVARINAQYAKDNFMAVGFEGSFGSKHVNPRSLKSQFLGNLVCCEGIVTKVSSVHPKVSKSVHFCPATKKTLERTYADLTSYSAFPTSNIYPTEDENKNPLETEFGMSSYVDNQTFTIQELPECAPAGQIPRCVDVFTENDLADRVKPGDRVRIVALYRVLPNKQQGFSNGSFRSILIANNIILLSKEAIPDLLPEDVKNIRKLSKRKDVFELLSHSLAPSICGHDEVKKAILCLLLGGTEKILDNGSRLRGDVNVLMIGDPSVAKSQLLRYVLHSAPRAIATTGRGSSGVGLTAAVTTDPESGDRRLEAGAMVLADRGIVCIDEFDKMSDMDRTAIHEVMEQGRVTISKAGIHAKLNARCSVLAAANPVYGRYDPFKTPMENIAMQDSLLSRFDLIFVLLDEHDASRDKSIADHVLKLHRYRTPGEAEGAVLSMGAGVDTMTTLDLEASEKTTEMYEENTDWTNSGRILSIQFVKKYIHLARGIKPKLTESATEFISKVYADIRSFDTAKTDRERTMPITARQLETLIRLSTAIAKSRFSKTVDHIDAEKAYNLLHFACFKEKPKAKLEYEMQKKARIQDADDSDKENDMDDSQESSMDVSSVPPSSSTRGTKRRPRSPVVSDEPMSSKRSKDDPSISVDRYRQFMKLATKAFDDFGVTDDIVELIKVTEAVQAQTSQPFTESEIAAAYERMSDENALMIVDDKCTRI